MAREREGGSEKAGGVRTHRWAIDRVEEGTAAVEQDGDHVYEVPRFLIPADARDGDVLAVTMTPDSRGAVTVSVRIERSLKDADTSRKSPSRQRPGKDSGGDIVL